MIILSKKPIELRAPDGQKMIVRPHDLANVPDKFTADPMFSWCVSDGTFTIAGKSKSAKETVAVPATTQAEGLAPETATLPTDAPVSQPDASDTQASWTASGSGTSSTSETTRTRTSGKNK